MKLCSFQYAYKNIPRGELVATPANYKTPKLSSAGMDKSTTQHFEKSACPNRIPTEINNSEGT